jgi:Fe-S-cluster containining protein
VIDSTASELWYADGLAFACTQCGNCCSGAPGYVWITVPELAQIAKHLGLTTRAFDARHVRRVGRRRSLLEKAGGDCEFLVRDPNGKTRCSIHPVRPRQCRTWPFWKSNVERPEAWNATARDCPGIGQGPHHSLPVIQQALHENGNLPL